jgi:hypothetical protein
MQETLLGAINNTKIFSKGRGMSRIVFEKRFATRPFDFLSGLP